MSDGGITPCRSCGGTELCAGAGPRGRHRSPTPSSIREQLARPGRPVPVGDLVLPRLHARAARYPLPAEAIFDEEYPYFSSFSDALMRPRRRARRRPHRLAPARSGVASPSRSPATTGTCCATSSPRASGPSASIRPRGRPRRAEASASRRSRGSSASRRRRRCVPSTGRPTCIIANNVMAHVPDLNDFVGGFAAPARRRRPADRREPVRARPGRARRVRHDLPRALLLLLVLGRRGADGSPRPAPQRRRVLPEAARRDPALAHRQAPERTDRCAAYLADERASGLTTFAYYERFADTGADVPGRAPSPARRTSAPSGRRVAAYGAAAKGATLLNSTGHHHRPRRATSSTATCTSRVCSCRGAGCRSARSRRCSPISPTTC